jgi:phosphoglucomutase
LTLPGKDGADQIASMMTRLRADPPRVIDGIAVKLLRDFDTSQILAASGMGFTKAEDLPFPKSNVLQFELIDGTKVSVRPSGTEPKIKFYVSVKDPDAKGQSGPKLDQLKAKCRQRAERIEAIFVAMAKT